MKPEDLKHRRKALNLTQNELAEKLGVSGNTVSRWEKGEMKPDAEEMLELAMRYLEQQDATSALPEHIDQAIAALQQLREIINN